MSLTIDIAGQRFGFLTAIDQSGKQNRKVTWRCVCDCGREVVVNGVNLRNGTTRSCGCMYRGESTGTRYREVVDVTGQRFGRLLVLAHVGQDPRDRKSRFRCICDCGTEKIVRGECLRNGGSTSCGCYKTQTLQERKREVVGYSAAHERVRAERGNASGHQCVDCGGPAKDWSYDGTDPNALRAGKYNCPYSLSPAHYVARCKRCHKHYDDALRKATA